MKRDKNFWLLTLSVSFAIHAIFCVQAYSVAGEGGTVRNMVFYLLFYAHVMLIYFLPPAYPIDFTGGIWSVDWFRFIGKLLVAYPASLLYGWILSMPR